MIVLFGGNGFVGSAIRQALVASGHSVAAPGSRELSAADGERVRRFLVETKPEFVINAAGYVGRPNVDAAETDKVNCLVANVMIPAVIAQACQELEIPWGHVSSGCIYQGSRPDGSGFLESDPPNFSFRTNNCSFYSGTKAQAEEILRDYPNTYIWRLRIPFNAIDNPRNYLTKLMRYERLASAPNSITQLDEFVAAVIDCWSKRLPFGTYNLTNPGVVTAREIVEKIDRAGLCPDKKWKFFESEEEFLREAAKTPRSNCILDSRKATAAGLRFTEVHEAIEQCLRNWKQ